MNKQIPELIPIRRIHNYIYCPRLMYFQFVENIFIHDANVVAGEITHRRVDSPTVISFPFETDDSSPDIIRSLSLESGELGICGVIDLLKRNPVDNSWIIYDYKHGAPLKDATGEFCAKDADIVQVQLYTLLARNHQYNISAANIYYAETKTTVSVPLYENEMQLLELIAEVKNCAAGNLPEPLEADTRCLYCSMNTVCLPEESLFWKSQKKITHPIQRPPLAENVSGEVLIIHEPQAWISKKGDVLVVSVSGETVSKHPVHLLKSIFIYGAAQLSTQVICTCLSEGIQVVFFSPAGKFLGRLDTLSISGLDSRYGQYKIAESEIHSVKLAIPMIRAKISNQRVLLQRNGKLKDRSVLNLMRSLRQNAEFAETREELQGIEGKAAAVYFENFSSMLNNADFANLFTGRNRRPPLDPVNAMLSLGYSVLSSEISGICASVGIDSACGLLHAPRFGRPALALDIMEEFRPLIIDSVVISVINRNSVGLEDFIFSSQGCSLKKSAHQAFWSVYSRRMNEELIHPTFRYRMSYRRLIEIQVRQLWRIFRGDNTEYFPIITR